MNSILGKIKIEKQSGSEEGDTTSESESEAVIITKKIKQKKTPDQQLINKKRLRPKKNRKMRFIEI